MPSLKTKLQPSSVIVAESTIQGSVAMELAPPKTIELRAGQELHVHHVFKLNEASPEQEEYRFALEIRVGNVRKRPLLRRFGDRWGLPDSVQGTLTQTHRFDTPGTHTVTYEAFAEYCKFEWKTHEVHQWDTVKKAGTVKVVVK